MKHRTKMRLAKIALYLYGDGWKRAAFLRKHQFFHSMGENVYYHTRDLPKESYLVSIGNNVRISANVRLITHDISASMINSMKGLTGKDKVKYFVGKIDIRDNVMIGANATVLPNTTIGPNAIVAAGSVVVKDVPEGSIVGGNPAKVIGRFDDFVEKRIRLSKNMPSVTEGVQVVEAFFWEDKD